ncbi:hypothetical protein CDD83_7182 [Cordyceps sp. RAO-2017]|nr:hypothetical protein CDD83_7182 [Cordyceps sp. RAO-2017]
MKSLSSPGLGPPRRPSRDGTQDMPSPLFDPAPVIQSNLSSLPRPFERRVSEPANSKALSGSTSLPSHSKKSASTPHTSVARGKQPRSENSRDPAEPKKVQSLEPLRSNQTSSAKTGSSFSARFPFFGRRKTAPDGIKPEKAEEARLKKPGRKGPVAGTGHEGYGRVGAIRRRSSGASNATGGAVDSPSTQPSLGNKDSFLADRVHPVVIAGGEVVENQNAGAADLGTSEGEKAVLGGGRPGTHSKTPSGHALPSDKASRLTVWPPIALHGPHGGASTLPNPHAGGAAGVSVPKPPSLALRRSVQRLRSSPDNPIRLPQPIIVDAPVSASPPTTSIDASSTSGDSHLQLQKETSHASNDSYPAATKPKKRGRLPRKWNLFGRSQSRQATRENGEEVQATVIAVDKKRVAFYAMMDSSESQESKPLSSREELRMSDVSIPSPSLLFNVPEHRPGNASSPLELQHIATTTPRSLSSVVRDDHGQVNTPSGQFHADPVPDPSSHPGKASRLPQVGRIPQVGQNRAENASAQTFSRPFRTSLQAAPRVTLSVYDPESIATGPTPPRPSTPVPDSTVERAPTDSEAEDCCNSDSLSKLSSETGCAAEEFLAFYLRKHSVGTTDTSSCCSTSVCVGADSTAVVPEPDDPLDEDEIWDEYNDLLDEGAVRTFSAAMAPSHPLPALPSSAHDGTTGRQSVWMVPESHKTGTHSRALSQSTSGSADMAQRIGRAFQPHPVHSAAPLAAPDPTPRSSPGRRKSQAPAEDGPRAGADRHSVASTLTVFTDCSAATSSDEESPLAQVNLRVGSMSVSKWLTFGHVLFSDVRHELDLVDGPAKRLSILVIDGLGNDDWSFYAAETYPAASFYNLSPRAAAPADAQKAPSRFPLSPPNHHQVQYRCHLDKFPFAPQSFDCVVYRFPVAAPESCYRNIIHESRRVLRTGGHIELSVLDADLNSMGNQARRTVRWLKERIHGEAAGVNLASTADVMLRLLGQAGFSSVKAARVGVPVASSITRPEAQRRSDSKGTGQREAASLAEMMRDKSPMADESINKLVTRVGRWWYTRCYENAAGSSAEKSIWCNKALLSECEELGTSLKLMVCCARAPNRIPSL